MSALWGGLRRNRRFQIAENGLFRGSERCAGRPWAGVIAQSGKSSVCGHFAGNIFWHFGGDYFLRVLF